MSTIATAEDILRGVPETKKNSPITDEHIAVIAEQVTCWESLAPHLGLNEADEEAIAEDHKNKYELQKRNALRVWRERNGSRATYHQLVQILCRIRHIALAEKVKEVLLSKENDKSPQSTVLTKIRKHLKDCYTKKQLQISDLHLPFGSRAYVPITLRKAQQEHRQDHPSPSGQIQQGEQFSNLSLTEVFQRVEVATPTMRNVVLIKGVAGSGKTTLIQHATQQWAAGELLQKISLVILVPLQYAFIRSAKSLADIIPHPAKRIRKKVADMIIEQDGASTCFLFDTWDEMPDKDLEESFVHNLIAGTLGQFLPHCSIVVTSRPEASAILQEYATTTLEVNRFTNSQIQQYIHCSIGRKHGEEATKRFNEILLEKSEVASLCDLPINIVILTFLFSFEKSLPATRTKLFKCFVLNLLRTHLKERTSHKLYVLKEFQSLPNEIYQKFLLLCRLAYHGVVTNTTTFNEQDLRALKTDALKDATVFGLMQVSHYLHMYGLEMNYSFLHHAVQDFLGAYYLSTLQKQKRAKQFDKILKHSPLSLVLPFYAGLTRLKEPQIISMLTEVAKRPLSDVAVLERLPRKSSDQSVASDDRRLLLALLNCTYESQRPEICLAINPPTDPRAYDRGSLDTHISFTHLRLDPSDCVCIGYFAANICHKKTCHIDLSDCRIGDHGVQLLLKEIICKNPTPYMTNQIQNTFKGLSPVSLEYMMKEYSKMHPLVNRCVELALQQNNITHHGTRLIGKILRRTSVITRVHLASNWHPSITNIGVAFKYLIEGLSRNTTCHYLSLSAMHLKPCHAHYIVLLITFCKGIKCLSLDLNHHLRDSMPLLASALKHNNNLADLYMEGCNIGEQQLLALAEGLQHDQSLRGLSIANNEYSVDAAVALVGYLKTSSVRQLFMNRKITMSNSVREAIEIANKERSRRRDGGSKCELTLETSEEYMTYNERVRLLLPSQVPEQLLRNKHAS